ncbi:glycerophosphoryl diester phosphodiesterase [Arthrobacter alpinus]|uniref:Glycerophosphoryl diester phosphodiesterase n=1 Tax=Arthrobacter alpinus TaxID=656366 RepID=A0A1H5NJD1_9MICC|nr:glycerophosphodiester phosphodiesterase family protein [Arthrobacter alpinus]SEF01560.1 glycerophosphoryl diester phosphodiesterase [Arthrobacter alpinus]
MHIYAHRGVSAHLPENTLAAFSRAIDLGVTGIELDVHLSADEIPVVIHDDTADRTTNGTGSITEFTARQLGLLDAGSGQYVPTLAQVLNLAAGKVRVNIEIKDAAAIGPVAEVVDSIPGLDWFASSADWDALAELGRKVAGTKVYPLCIGKVEKLRAFLPDDATGEEFAGRGLVDAIAFALNNGGEGVSIWEGGLDADDIQTIHDAGLKAWVWTVNDPERARELLDMGADGICTDDPALIQEVIRAAEVSVGH